MIEFGLAVFALLAFFALLVIVATDERNRFRQWLSQRKEFDFTFTIYRVVSVKEINYTYFTIEMFNPLIPFWIQESKFDDIAGAYQRLNVLKPHKIRKTKRVIETR